LRVFISKHFFSYRYDYRKEWLFYRHAERGCRAAIEQRAIMAMGNLAKALQLWLLMK
jgi:hypothetical protein